MKFAIVVLCITLQVILGSAADVAPKRDIGVELGEIQQAASTLHNEIENYIQVYRSTLSEINAENGVNVALEKLQNEITNVYERDVTARLEIWLGASGDCADDLTAQLDAAFEVAGNQLSECSVLYNNEISEAATGVLAKLDELQADSTYLQFATVFGINTHNVFTEADDTVDGLMYKVESFRRIWEEDVSVEFTNKLSLYRERFIVINATWNVCLQEAGAAYGAEADRVVDEISGCPAKK